MTTPLHVLPHRVAGAAENMATDFLLLQRYPEHAAPRFRHYGWRAPAFTFGYAQKIASVREAIGRAFLGPPFGTSAPVENTVTTDDDIATGAPDDSVLRQIDLCRRPTGGGVVDHRNDWTYALVIPRGHPLEDLRASHSYRAIHEAVANALRAQAVSAELKAAAPDSDEENAGVCFQRAEIFDVINAVTGSKIAGAAQKRNKHGLLFQGSVWRPALAREIDWDQFHADFTVEIARQLGADAEAMPWPELNDDELSALIEQYSSAEWLEFR